MNQKATEDLIAASEGAIERLRQVRAELELLQLQTKTILLATQANLDTLRKHEQEHHRK